LSLSSRSFTTSACRPTGQLFRRLESLVRWLVRIPRSHGFQWRLRSAALLARSRMPLLRPMLCLGYCRWMPSRFR